MSVAELAPRMERDRKDPAYEMAVACGEVFTADAASLQMSTIRSRLDGEPDKKYPTLAIEDEFGFLNIDRYNDTYYISRRDAENGVLPGAVEVKTDGSEITQQHRKFFETHPRPREINPEDAEGITERIQAHIDRVEEAKRLAREENADEVGEVALSALERPVGSTVSIGPKPKGASRSSGTNVQPQNSKTIKN